MPSDFEGLCTGTVLVRWHGSVSDEQEQQRLQGIQPGRAQVQLQYQWQYCQTGNNTGKLMKQYSSRYCNCHMTIQEHIVKMNNNVAYCDCIETILQYYNTYNIRQQYCIQYRWQYSHRYCKYCIIVRYCNIVSIMYILLLYCQQYCKGLNCRC